MIVFGPGCRGPEAIPRIDPTLRNWHEHYRSTDNLRIHAFNTGSVALPAGFVYHGGSWFESRDFEVPAFVIEHPREGLVVFDTGLAAEAASHPARYLGIIPSLLASVSVSQGQGLPSQMRAVGLSPEAVKYVVISDMHFDHTGAIEAFPNAVIVVARKEREAALQAAWYDFYIPADYDEAPRWLEIDYEKGEGFATFAAHHDLLGDGSVVLIDLHGHTSGTQGAVIRTSAGPVVLTGDAAAVEESWRYAARPAYAEETAGWWEQAWRLKKFADLVPSAIVVPGHDLTPLDRVTDTAIVVHEFSP